MKTILYPSAAEWPALCERATVGTEAAVTSAVSAIVEDVASRGDDAIAELEERFTGSRRESLLVSEAEMVRAAETVAPSLREAIELAARNIEAFHRAQMPGTLVVTTTPGVVCEQRPVAIERVGLYVPGGNSPLFSTVLMLAVPARIAGCREVTLCTPADSTGSIHPAILYAARLAGVTKVFAIGGAQAVAAMALGTATVGRVDKIFGPGNRYVMEAKQQVASRGVAIDMPAGPSEVMVIADSEACAEFVAADFLSQAEHGPDSQSILLTDSPRLIEELPGVIDRLLDTLPRRAMMEQSLSHSRLILLHDADEMMALSNIYAPEHLIINHVDAERLAAKVVNAGSVFLGSLSPESAGDYASGTNHTLPTSGYARAYSGVNMESFVKRITFQRLSPEGVMAIGPAVEEMALNEDLMAHRLAMTLRINQVTQQNRTGK